MKSKRRDRSKPPTDLLRAQRAVAELILQNRRGQRSARLEKLLAGGRFTAAFAFQHYANSYHRNLHALLSSAFQATLRELSPRQREALLLEFSGNPPRHKILLDILGEFYQFMVRSLKLRNKKPLAELARLELAYAEFMSTGRSAQEPVSRGALLLQGQRFQVQNRSRIYISRYPVFEIWTTAKPRSRALSTVAPARPKSEILLFCRASNGSIAISCLSTAEFRLLSRIRRSNRLLSVPSTDLRRTAQALIRKGALERV